MTVDEQMEISVRGLVNLFSVVEVDQGPPVWFEKSGLKLADGRIGKTHFLTLADEVELCLLVKQ